jgi:hypothetical protein
MTVCLRRLSIENETTRTDIVATPRESLRAAKLRESHSRELTMNRTHYIGWILLLTASSAVSCCRQKNFEPTCAVNGTVTLDQKTLPKGVIVFVTPETGDLQAIPIEDGHFQGQARPGKRRIEIRAYPPQTEKPKPMAPPPVNYLSARYNVESLLTAEVIPQGPNTFDFELRSR